MITFEQFIEKWLGKKADFDGAYNGQCVDLFRFYVQEVLGLPQPKGVSGAKNFWTNYESDPSLKNYYEKIPNTPSNIPKNGDVVFWNEKAGGGYGHVAMWIEGDVNKFTSFDQNWPTLSVCTKTVHDYKNVYGWFRPKVTNPPPIEEMFQKCVTDRDSHWNDRIAVCRALELPEDSLIDTIIRSINAYKGSAAKSEELEKKVQSIETAYKEQLSTLQQQLLDKQQTVTTLSIGDAQVVQPYIDQLDSKDKQITKMAEEIRQLKLSGPKNSLWETIKRLLKIK